MDQRMTPHRSEQNHGARAVESIEARVFPYSPPEKMDKRPVVPSGKRTHVVRPGESLWSIAEEVLQTDEPARIARYWPRIHRANRSVIGADPNVLLPGQVLELPGESGR